MNLQSFQSFHQAVFQSSTSTVWHSHSPQTQPSNSGIPPSWPDLLLWLCLVGDLCPESSQLWSPMKPANPAEIRWASLQTPSPPIFSVVCLCVNPLRHTSLTSWPHPQVVGSHIWSTGALVPAFALCTFTFLPCKMGVQAPHLSIKVILSNGPTPEDSESMCIAPATLVILSPSDSLKQ